MIEIFPIAREPATTAQPREGALNDPAFGQHDKLLCGVGSFHDFDVHPRHDLLQRTPEYRSLIAAIGVEFQQEGKHAEQGRHHQPATVAVLNVGGVHDGVHQQALRIDEDVTFLAFDLLAGVIPRRVMEPPFSALLTLWLSMIAAVGLASRAACSRHAT